MEKQLEENEAPDASPSKKSVFVFGLVSGLVSGLILSGKWRPIAKSGIKAGTKGWRKVSEVAQKAMGDFQDVVAEANHELAQEEGKPGTPEEPEEGSQ
jgi:hypothetical protein